MFRLTNMPDMVSATLSEELAVPTFRQEDMHHPSHVWSDPESAHEHVERLRVEYLSYLRGRSRPTSAGTIDKYNKALLSLNRSVVRQGFVAELASYTPAAVNRWIDEQRQAARS